MSMPLKPLAARRLALVVRAQEQRMVLQQAAADVRTSIAFADRALALLRKVTRKPLLAALTTAAVAMTLFNPRRGIKWLGYAATAYSLSRRVRKLLSNTGH